MINDRAEKAMRQLVDHNCINPSDVTRKINNLMLGNLNNFTQSINYQVSYTNLADELENISNISNLGHWINLNISNKQLILDIYKGLDRSINQSVNPMCIFSKEFENVLEQEYIDSLNNYRNLALVGGMGEGTERKLTTVGSASGLDRYELFVDQRNLSKTIIVNGVSTTITDSDYLNLLIGKGNEKLAVTKEVETFDSKININSNLEYKSNFNIGDIVTCISKKWNLQLDARISEIEEVYEKVGKTINITFGDNIPTLIDKIKQKL